jgi:hypothetical protein
MVVGVNLSMCVVYYYSDIRLSRLTCDVFIALMGYNSVCRSPLCAVASN